MDVIEKAIRSAFEKGNAADQAFREKVYRQAFSALDRVLQANPGLTVETAMRRRKALQAKIVEIEQEFLPGRPRPVVPPVASAVEPEPEPPALDAPEPQVAAVETRNDRQVDAPVVRRVDPVVPDDPTIDQPLPPRPARTEPESATPAVDSDPRSRRRPSKFASFFVAASLFSLIAMGIWWGVQTGLIGSAEQTEPVAVEPADPEDFEPGDDQPPVQPAEAVAERNWVLIFGPSDLDAMSAPADAKAEIVKRDNGDVLRITSGTSGSAILFDVGQGVLEQIAGKTATFDIVARAEDGKDTQMSVLCNFGELGDCGRKRYAVGNARADYLFELDVPQKKPGAGGTIAINSDFDKAGKSVDIYEIKVSVGQ